MKKKAESHREERLNTISHALGAILGLVGLFLLLIKNGHKSIYATESIVVYSVTFVLMFVTSALYHGVSTLVVKTTSAGVRSYLYLLVDCRYVYAHCFDHFD
ncbi:MAG: hemolysin III family protein [Flavobacteriaceae bacterium]